MNKDILKTLFPDRYQRIEEGKCAECVKEIDLDVEFEDNDIGMKEFLISGLCTICQSKVFNSQKSLDI